MVPRTAPADWREHLGGAFDITHVKLVGDAEQRAGELANLLEADPENIVAINLEPGQVHLLRRRSSARLAGAVPADRSAAWAEIAPNVLRYGILEPLWEINDADLAAGVVEYSHDTHEVLEFLDGHPGSTAFLLNPVTIESVMSLADQRERMPQKSTFFHPKLGTGLVFHPLDP